MEHNEISKLKHEVRCNIEAIVEEAVADDYCTLELISSSNDTQRFKFYWSSSQDDTKTIMVEGDTFQEVLEIAIIRAKAIAGEYKHAEKND